MLELEKMELRNGQMFKALRSESFRFDFKEEVELKFLSYVPVRLGACTIGGYAPNSYSKAMDFIVYGEEDMDEEFFHPMRTCSSSEYPSVWMGKDYDYVIIEEVE